MARCPECGVDDYTVKYADKTLSELVEVSSRFKTIRANHALASAEWELEKISLQESMKYLQRKVKKQAEAISRLEEKIHRLGHQPYKEKE